MDNMTIHDWNKHYDILDLTLAKKYRTKKHTIRFIRVSSIRKNLSHTQVCLLLAKMIGKSKNDGVRKQKEEMFRFVAGLSYEDWMDITKPNAQAIDYMVTSDQKAVL